MSHVSNQVTLFQRGLSLIKWLHTRNSYECVQVTLQCDSFSMDIRVILKERSLVFPSHIENESCVHWEWVTLQCVQVTLRMSRVSKSHCRSQRHNIQDTATHCNTLQDTARHCSTLQDTARHCKTLQDTAGHCKTLQHCNTLQDTATHYNTLQDSTLQDTTLQDTARHCKKLQDTAIRPSHIAGARDRCLVCVSL